MTPLLPTLPRMPGEGETFHYMPSGDSIITLLAEDHEALNARCSDLAANPTPQEATVLVATLSRHLSGERQYLYPAVAKAEPGHSQNAAVRQSTRDVAIMSELHTFSRAELAGPAWREALDRITDAVHSHGQFCAVHLFAPLRAAVSDADLVRLGNRLQIAVEAAPSRPHLWAPMHAPLNKITDSFIGAVDKVRDVATGRRPYPNAQLPVAVPTAA